MNSVNAMLWFSLVNLHRKTALQSKKWNGTYRYFLSLNISSYRTSEYGDRSYRQVPYMDVYKHRHTRPHPTRIRQPIEVKQKVIYCLLISLGRKFCQVEPWLQFSKMHTLTGLYRPLVYFGILQYTSSNRLISSMHVYIIPYCGPGILLSKNSQFSRRKVFHWKLPLRPKMVAMLHFSYKTRRGSLCVCLHRELA